MLDCYCSFMCVSFSGVGACFELAEDDVWAGLEVTGGWIELHNEECSNLYCSLNSVNRPLDQWFSGPSKGYAKFLRAHRRISDN
jgi:hypothetical protein